MQPFPMFSSKIFQNLVPRAATTFELCPGTTLQLCSYSQFVDSWHLWLAVALVRFFRVAIF